MTLTIQTLFHYFQHNLGFLFVPNLQKSFHVTFLWRGGLTLLMKISMVFLVPTFDSHCLACRRRSPIYVPYHSACSYHGAEITHNEKEIDLYICRFIKIALNIEHVASFVSLKWKTVLKKRYKVIEELNTIK